MRQTQTSSYHASGGPHSVSGRRRIYGKKINQMQFIREHPEGIVFKVFVQPRSSKNQIVGAHGDALKVKVTAPPVAGAANKMCLKFLAKSLSIPQLLLEIITGHNSRTKQVLFRSEHTPPSEKEKRRLRHSIEKLIHN
jgi:uncharacterized protein (TIGR00251 family)